LCSRVCHDVISPVGAIANGLELIDDPEMDAETKETALAMVRSSARTACTTTSSLSRMGTGAAAGAAGAACAVESGGQAKTAVPGASATSVAVTSVTLRNRLALVLFISPSLRRFKPDQVPRV